MGGENKGGEGLVKEEKDQEGGVGSGSLPWQRESVTLCPQPCQPL